MEGHTRRHKSEYYNITILLSEMKHSSIISTKVQSSNCKIDCNNFSRDGSLDGDALQTTEGVHTKGCVVRVIVMQFTSLVDFIIFIIFLENKPTFLQIVQKSK